MGGIKVASVLRSLTPCSVAPGTSLFAAIAIPPGSVGVVVLTSRRGPEWSAQASCLEVWLSSQVQILALQLSSCVVCSRLLNLSVAVFSRRR